MTDLAVYGRLDALQGRIERLEEVVSALAGAAGMRVDLGVPPAPSGIDADILARLEAGDRVGAIREAAQALGVTLKEATEYVGRVEGGA